MAAYSYGSSYESVMKKNCGYRQLGNYYNKLYGNITTDQPIPDDQKIAVVPMFGGIPYGKMPTENYTPMSNMRSNNGDGPTPTPNSSGSQCNSWRKGQCCDGRSLSKDAYTQCVSGNCSYYSDERATGNGMSLYSRY
jgi:hypothetical protein